MRVPAIRLPLFTTDLGAVRILRLFRIFRLFRITRYGRAVRLIRNGVSDKKEKLILSIAFAMLVSSGST